MVRLSEVLRPFAGAVRRTIAAVAFLSAVSNAFGDAEQLADAWADVFTFGGWGKSRDQHDAEIQLLKIRFEEELARTRNIAKANIATARIEEKLKSALWLQYNCQELLRLGALCDSILAQVREEVERRYALNSEVKDFAAWFDNYSSGNSEKIKDLVALLSSASTLDPNDITKLREAARISSKVDAHGVSNAKESLRQAVVASDWHTLDSSIALIIQLKTSITALIDKNREQITTLVVEMQAEDEVRRTLCDVDTVGVNKNEKGEWSYYAAISNDPCHGLRFINIYPVEPFLFLVQHSENYDKNAIFFADLARINSVGAINGERFRTPREVFGDRLNPEDLVPEPFRVPRVEVNIDNEVKRLEAAFAYVERMSKVTQTSETLKDRVKSILAAEPLLLFKAEGLATEIKLADSRAPSSSLALRLEKLAQAITALEGIGMAILQQEVNLEKDNRFQAVLDLSNL